MDFSYFVEEIMIEKICKIHLKNDPLMATEYFMYLSKKTYNYHRKFASHKDYITIHRKVCSNNGDIYHRNFI